MGGDLQLGSILVFALVAIFLFFRLRSVLGKRTGQERPRDLFSRRTGTPPSPAPVPSNGPVIDARAEPVAEPPAQAPLATGLARLKSADRNFDEQSFLKGARGAFEIIVNAFAVGDTSALKPLLSEDVYRSFADAIAQRQAAHETHETTLVTIKSVDLVEAGLEGTIASVTVKLVSDQVNVTRAADGSAIDGSPDEIVEKTDFWTFSRDTRSRDPNWLLVATRSP